METTSVRRNILFAVLLVAAGAVVYANSIPHSFVWDDEILVVNNPAIRSLTNVPSIFGSMLFRGMKGNFYRPAQTLSYALDYSLWGLRPAAFHSTNVAIHIADALLLFALLGAVTGRKPLSFLAALLFVVHPVNTEAVSYVSGRADLLAAFFILLSCLAFVRFAERRGGGRRAGLYAASLAAFALALFSKEAACVLPLLLYACVSCRERGSVPSAAAWTGFVLVFLAYCAVRAAVHFSGGGILTSNPYPFAGRLLTSFTVILLYLRLLVLPVGLHMERIVPIENTLFSVPAALSLLLVCLLAAAAARLSRRSAPARFGILWFCIALLPYLNWFPLNAEMAEHWLYIPAAGFYLLGALALEASARGNPRRAVLLSAPLIICLSAATIGINRDWRDEKSIYLRTVRLSPGSPRAHYNMGNIYRREGRLGEAVREYRKSLSLKPWDANSHHNLGKALLQLGAGKEAEAEFSRAIALAPSNSAMRSSLGVALGMRGENERAIAAFRDAIARDPLNARAYSNMAGALTNLGRLDEALTACGRALELDPGMVEAQFNMGVIHCHRKEYRQAIARFDRALALNPGFRRAAVWREKAEKKCSMFND